MAPRPRILGDSPEPSIYGMDYGAASTMAGGTGDDTYIIDNSGDRIVERHGEGTDTAVVMTGEAFALPDNVEIARAGSDARVVMFGNDAPNTLIGRGGDDHLNGAGGDDKIDGGKGNDYINGGRGNDYMAGGTENDTYVIDSASDIVREYEGEGIDTAEVHIVAYSLPANVENAYMMAGGTATHSLYGNSLANQLHGGASNNRLYGGEGDDHLFGYYSADLLEGGAGADRMTGGGDDDTFVLRRGEADGDVLVDFDGAYGWPGDSITFVGYGSGAFLTRDDATHWTVHSGDGLVHETFEVLTGRTIVESDYFFV